MTGTARRKTDLIYGWSGVSAIGEVWLIHCNTDAQGMQEGRKAQKGIEKFYI